jgi:hypothetical protein
MLWAMQQGLNKANITILGLHRDLSNIRGVISDSIHALDCHLQSLQTTVGKPRSLPDVMAVNNWEARSVMGQNTHLPGLDLAALDVQASLGSLAALLTGTNQDTTTS